MQNQLPMMMQVEKQSVDVDAMSFEQTVKTIRSSSRSNFLLIGKLVEHAVEDLGKSVDDLAESVDFHRSYLFSARKCYQRFGDIDFGDRITKTHLRSSVGWDDAEEWLALANSKGWSSEEMVDAREKSPTGDKSDNESEQEVEYEDVDDEQPEGESVDHSGSESITVGPTDGSAMEEVEAAASTAEDVESGDEEESDESAFASDVEYEDVPDDEDEPKVDPLGKPPATVSGNYTLNLPDGEPDFAALDMPKIPPGSTKEQFVNKLAKTAIKTHCSQIIKLIAKCQKVLGEGENCNAIMDLMDEMLDRLKAISEGKA